MFILAIRALEQFFIMF